MPLKLNVGLSRKVGEPNYGSRGASVNLEIELDGALVNEPERLKERIRQLFGLVRVSVTEELHGAGGQQVPTPVQTTLAEASSHDANGNGNGSPSNGGTRPATAAQIKALYAIARKQGLDLREVIKNHGLVQRPEALTLSQASSLIDDLKCRAPAPV